VRRWFMSIILVILEAQIGKIADQGQQSGKKSSQDSISINILDMVIRVYNPSYKEGINRRILV
jgi:hypothetical protein